MGNSLKNIAFISEHASPLADLGGVDTGGQNVYVAQLAKFLAIDDLKVDVYTRWEDGTLPQVVEWKPNVRVIHVKAGPVNVISKEKLLPYMNEFAENMLKFIYSEKINYDMVHANFFMSGFVASEIKKALHIPFVVTFHALGHVRRFHQGNNDLFPVERIKIETDVTRSADAVIAECPQDRDDLMNYYQVPSEKITIIPCGFCPDEFYPVKKTVARKLLNIPKNEFIILQLGRMVPRKGVDNVVKALGHLKTMGKKVKLVIVGGEHEDPSLLNCPETIRLKNIAEEHGVLDTVKFAGRKSRDQLKYYYAAADIFITTPWYEPFGITPLEAMACGTPVIGANVGGIKYSVADGKTGALVSPHDPKGLADKVAELLADKETLKLMGINAIRRVNQYFTWAKVAGKVSDLYRKILSNNKSGSLISTMNKRETQAA
jgi:D-inositol-3-phosphate glycosyltransferase